MNPNNFYSKNVGNHHEGFPMVVFPFDKNKKDEKVTSPIHRVEKINESENVRLDMHKINLLLSNII